MSSLPDVNIVPESVKSDILQGKDVNLAVLLFSITERKYVESGTCEIKINDEIIPLKPCKDVRLSKNLTSQEFIQAFNIYTGVMCEVYPNRRDELAKYMFYVVVALHCLARLCFL